MSFFSVEAVASLLNKTPGEITDALKESEDAEKDQWLSQQLKEHISSAVTVARSKAHDEGYGRGKRESLTAEEKRIRDKYEVDGSTLEEIVDAAIEKNREASKANPEDVKTSPEYLEMERKYKDRIKELSDEVQAKEAARQRDQVMGKVKSIIESTLMEKGFALPEDPVKKSKWINVILSDLEDDDTALALNADGEPVVLGKDGKVKTDDVTMRDITFEDRLTNVAGSYLDVSNKDGKQGTGNKTQGQQSGANQFDFSHIKSSDDYINAMGKLDIEKDADQLKAMEGWYNEQVREGAIT